MSKLDQDEEAKLTVDWLGEVREAEIQDELKYVSRFDDTTGSIKLVLDERLPSEEEDVAEESGHTPVTPVDLDEDYFSFIEEYDENDEVPQKVLSIEEECKAFMESLESSLEEFQKSMDARWADLLAPLVLVGVSPDPSLTIFQQAFESGAQE